MCNKYLFVLVFVLVLASVPCFAWITWNANEFPEEFQNGNAFTITGSGTREIVTLSEEDKAYRCVANTASEGYSFTTKSGYWTNADSTIKFRMKIHAYNDGQPKATSVKIKDAERNRIWGFIWKTEDGNDLIQAVESNNSVVEFNNLGEYVTYRIIYDKAGTACFLYSWNEEDEIWIYLLKSQGYSSGVTISEFFIGDDSISTAGDWQISFLTWTNEGIAELDYVLPKAYYYAYDACLGVLPNQVNPQWTSQYYDSNSAKMSLDLITDENILELDHSATTVPETYSNFTIPIGSEENEADDFVTFEMRFRLLDAEDTDQLGFFIRQPPNPKQISEGFTEQNVHVSFHFEGVKANPDGVLTNYPFAIGNDWHVIRLTFDVRKANVSLFMDNSSIPLVSFDAGAVNSGYTRSHIVLGDASNSITGHAAIAWARWTSDAAEIPLVGGQLELLGNRIIVSEPLVEDHLNFPQAYRWNDGTYWLQYAIGDHKYPEEQTTEQFISYTGGTIWQEPDFWIAGRNCWQFSDDSILSVGLTAAEPNTVHDVRLHHWTSSTTGYLGSTTTTIILPWSIGNMSSERKIIQLSDGRLLLSVKGIKQGDTKRGTFIIHSTDQGQTWSYLSSVSFDQTAGVDGYHEPCLALLPNGNILCLMRTGSTSPMYQSISSDGGYSWSTPVQISDYGVFPDLLVLNDGTLVASSGRPGLFVMVDFTGTGQAWQKVPLYDGGPYPYLGGGYDDDIGCSYTNLVEVQPNLVMLLYTESGFWGSNLESYALPNTIRATYFRIRHDRPGDFNNDGDVNNLDYLELVRYCFGGAPATFGTGIMDNEELILLFECWFGAGN